MLGSYKHGQLEPHFIQLKATKETTNYLVQSSRWCSALICPVELPYLLSVIVGVAVGCSIVNVDGSSCSNYIRIWNSCKNVSEILQSHLSICCQISISGSLEHGVGLFGYALCQDQFVSSYYSQCDHKCTCIHEQRKEEQYLRYYIKLNMCNIQFFRWI
jgi:hypothetical protein